MFWWYAKNLHSQYHRQARNWVQCGASAGHPTANCILVSWSLLECLRVVGPESQGCQIPEFTGPMQWPSGAPGSTWERRRQAWERQQHTWERWQAREHVESLYSSLWKTSSSLGTLLVQLEIIATTYRSTIVKSHVFGLNSHLCIYIAAHLHTGYLDWLQAVLESNSRRSWKWWSSKLRDKLRGRGQVNMAMHLEAVIMRTWRL